MDRSPGMEFIPWAYANAQSILQGALDCAEAAGRGDCAVLKMLYDCLALEVQLCNQIGQGVLHDGGKNCSCIPGMGQTLLSYPQKVLTHSRNAGAPPT